MGIDIPSSDLESVFPYARLSCFGIDEKNLRDICSIFSLKIINSQNNSVFNLTSLAPNPGEHKLQTVTLLAAALILNQRLPKAKMSLSVQRDFMKDSVPVEENPLQEFENVPEGSLKVSSACQIFLSQAGFKFTVSEHDVVFQKEGICGFSEFLKSHGTMSSAVGA